MEILYYTQGKGFEAFQLPGARWGEDFSQWIARWGYEEIHHDGVDVGCEYTVYGARAEDTALPPYLVRLVPHPIDCNFVHDGASLMDLTTRLLIPWIGLNTPSYVEEVRNLLRDIREAVDP